MPQFLGSSVVEQLAVNQLVVGSNPTRGAILYKIKNTPSGVFFEIVHQNFLASPAAATGFCLGHLIGGDFAFIWCETIRLFRCQ